MNGNGNNPDYPTLSPKQKNTYRNRQEQNRATRGKTYKERRTEALKENRERQKTRYNKKLRNKTKTSNAAKYGLND